MKKLLLALMLLFTMNLVVSCTPEEMNDETELANDPDKTCPPNDRNCNGIPDDQEN